MSSSITVQDIDRLIELCHRFQSFKPDVPPVNQELWDAAKAEAKQQLDEALKNRRFIAPPAPFYHDIESRISEYLGGKISPTVLPDGVSPEEELKTEFQRLEKLYYANDPKAPQLGTMRNNNEGSTDLQKRNECSAERIYCKNDPAYAAALDKARQEKADLLKEIDHNLLPIQSELVKYPRITETILAAQQFHKDIRQFININSDWLHGHIAEVIDVLEAVRVNIERQNRIVVKHEPESEPNADPVDPAAQWSKPMAKSAIMQAFGIDSYDKLKTLAKVYPMRQAGNRQLWQVRLDTMDSNRRSRFEKA